jgi:hypothetical protein
MAGRYDLTKSNQALAICIRRVVLGILPSLGAITRKIGVLLKQCRPKHVASRMDLRPRNHRGHRRISGEGMVPRGSAPRSPALTHLIERCIILENKSHGAFGAFVYRVSRVHEQALWSIDEVHVISNV